MFQSKRKKSHVIFSAGKHTRVRCLNKEQMKYYSDLSQKGFFNIFNAEQIDKMKE